MTHRTMQTRIDRPTEHPPLDYTSAETLAATMALRRPVAPKPILDASQYEEEAKAVAKRGGFKFGGKPASRKSQKGQESYDRNVMTPYSERLLSLLIEHPNNTNDFYASKMSSFGSDVSRRSVSNLMSRLRSCGHTINKTRAAVPRYSLGVVE